jgi:hypothetical protein
MLSHTTTREWLIPYADGMLAADERQRIDGHIAGCSACAAELREVRELNLLLVTLPPAPPVAFAPFWLKLQAVLPQRRGVAIARLFAYRRVALACAIAALGVLMAAGSALAAPAALPDSPLYPVKQLEETVRMTLTPSAGRLMLQMEFANERLRETELMAANHKPRLAASSLRAYQLIVSDAAAALKNPADPRSTQDRLRRLRLGLDAVERQNAAKDDDDFELRGLVIASIDQLDRIEHPDDATPGPLLVIGTPASPDPTPAPKPQPVLKPTPRPGPTDDDHRA